MDSWFEVVLTVYLVLSFILKTLKFCFMIQGEEEPEMTEEMRRRIYV